MNLDAKSYGLRSSWVLGALLASAGTSVALGQHQVCLYVDKSGLTGHAFVQMLPRSGPQAGRTDLVYGKYPAGADIFGGPGVIKWDKKRKWTQKICWTVTNAQYIAAGTKINTKIAAPTPYNLATANCVDWASAVVTAAGKTPPASAWFGVSDPETMGDTIKAVGNGGVLNGGTITYNATPSISPSGEPIALVEPRDFGARGMAAACRDNPGAVAAATTLPLNAQSAPFPVPGQIGVPFRVNLFNTHPSQALIAVNWGDGSDEEAQSLLFEHVYTSPGSYILTVAVVNHGAVNVLKAEVQINPTGPVGQIDVKVPTPQPPPPTPNPGFEDPPMPDNPCYADCNGDGLLNLADFGCFQTNFATGNPYADCNGDGQLNLADFGCFQTNFAIGCQ